MENFLFSSESVGEGHPDKLCDIISDSILDAYLEQDKNSRVAVETFASHGSIHIAGEITSNAIVNVEKIVRNCLVEIGYTDVAYGLSAEDVAIWISLNKQSPEIAQGVDEKENKELGAGDQGIMFGFACNETEELMPIPIMFAHKILNLLTKARKEKVITGLGPDSKSQVCFEYVHGKPNRIDSIVVAQQHTEGKNVEELREEIINKILYPLCEEYLDSNTKFFINTTGSFVIGGPKGDTGLTGRKIIVDSYGGYSRHGGGAFSGKDPTKVDRSAAYMARYMAKNIVAAGLADKCEVQLSYSIGLSKPLSTFVECFGTNKISEEKIVQAIIENFDASPKAIIEKFDLKNFKFKQTASYGHFGRLSFPWEKTDMVGILSKYLE
ncbi:methionine adenosyltransferase [archaeon]|nr:methionine adenosyltransferase [archaeon]